MTEKGDMRQYAERRGALQQKQQQQYFQRPLSRKQCSVLKEEKFSMATAGQERPQM